MESVAVPGGHADGDVMLVLVRVIGAAGDVIGPADEILPAAARHRFAVGDHALTGLAIETFGEMLVAALLVMARGRLRRLGAGGETQASQRHGADRADIRLSDCR